MKKGANITIKSSIRIKVSLQSCHFSCHISGLIAGRIDGLTAGQTSVSKKPAKHNRLSCLLKVGQLD
jgi:hypothetical protein